MKRFVTALGVVAVSVGLLAASAQANSTRARNMRGIVPSHGLANKFARRSSNMTYHGGAVMLANTVYAIYWIPSGYSVDSRNGGYQSVINGFFNNVAAASGSTSNENVYSTDTQYYETLGGATQHIAYNSAFAGAINDSDAFPASGCRDSYTSVCLTDAQLQSEIAHVVSSQGLPTGTGVEYFLFTPENVGSCDGSACSFSYYCAYHSNFTSNGNQILYANMPYAAWVPNACGSGQSPNDNDADSTINVTSHEHNETITDPLGTAWYDASGNEIGDKCAWNFGTSLGSSFYGQYNQLINGQPYYLQREWSNASSGCVQ